MTLKEKLQKDMVVAMKEKDKSRLSIIRMIISEVKNMEIKDKKELSDEEAVTVIQRVSKQTLESLEAFEKANTNPEKISELKYYLEVIKNYLPQQMTEEEVKTLVEKIIAENGFSSKKDTGKVMSAIMPLVKGKADGKIVNKVVSELLV